MVSVVMTCWNHQKTILRALESVLRQKTSFGIEIIFVDDGSTDGSFQLFCARAAETRSPLIHIHHQEHSGIMETYRKAFSMCNGKYIAVCDGDDYWVDDHKLQKQFDFMERFPAYGVCTTRVWQERVTGGLIEREDIGASGDEINRSLTFDNLLRGNSYLNAQTYFIRREVFDHWIDFSKFIRLGFYVWDYPIILELLNRTLFQHLDFVSAVFTIHPSYTHTTSRKRRLKMVVGQWWIRTYYIFRFGCRPSTFIYSWYRLARDIYSVIFKRWYK